MNLVSTTRAHSTILQDNRITATATHLVYTPSSHSKSSPASSTHAVKILIGVAVPVAVLSILTLGALIFRHCKRARTLKGSEKTLTPESGAGTGSKTSSNPSDALVIHELENSFGGFRELESRQIYKADGQSLQ